MTELRKPPRTRKRTNQNYYTLQIPDELSPKQIKTEDALETKDVKNFPLSQKVPMATAEKMKTILSDQWVQPANSEDLLTLAECDIRPSLLKTEDSKSVSVSADEDDIEKKMTARNKTSSGTKRQKLISQPKHPHQRRRRKVNPMDK